MKKLIIAGLIAIPCLSINASDITSYTNFDKANGAQYAQEVSNVAGRKALYRMHKGKNLPINQYNLLTKEAQNWKVFCDLRLDYLLRKFEGEDVNYWNDVLSPDNLQELELVCINPIHHILHADKSYSEKNTFEQLRDKVRQKIQEGSFQNSQPK